MTDPTSFWRWLVTPSGPDDPALTPVWRWLWDAPLPAHLIGGAGMLLAFLLDALIPHPWVYVWRTLVAAALWQALLIERIGWYESPARLAARLMIPPTFVLIALLL